MKIMFFLREGELKPAILCWLERLANSKSQAPGGDRPATFRAPIHL